MIKSLLNPVHALSQFVRRELTLAILTNTGDEDKEDLTMVKYSVTVLLFCTCELQ